MFMAPQDFNKTHLCHIKHKCITYNQVVQRKQNRATQTKKATAAAPSVEDVAPSLCERLQLLRKIHRLSLDELAVRASLTKSYLSKVERGLSEPSLATVLKLCRAFGITTGQLLGEEATDEAVLIVRKADRTPLRKLEHYDGYLYEAIATGREKKAMLPFVMHPPLRSKAADPDLVEHSGQELIFVLKGEIDFLTPGKTMRLAAGDAVYFDAVVPHRSFSVGKTPAEALVVVMDTARKTD
jgi:transcriptional regulator with XRE-family HTH domain